VDYEISNSDDDLDPETDAEDEEDSDERNPADIFQTDK